MKKRLTSWLLVLTMIVSLIPSTLVTASAADARPSGSGVVIGAYTQEYDVSTESADIEITDGGTYKLTGIKEGISVVVNTMREVTLVLDNLKLSNSQSPIQVTQGGNVTLVLLEDTTNTLTCTATNTTDRDNVNGMTAGINVPGGASLIVDRAVSKDAGLLTVKGGYGGAGIGGNAAVGFGSTASSGVAGAAGQTNQDQWSYTQLWNNSQLTTGVGGAGGAGGNGGKHGNSAPAAGSVTVKAGSLDITGGTGGAGIGGGMGVSGIKGDDGVPGKQGSKGACTFIKSDWANPPKHIGWMSVGGSGGSGGGGAGGNGGNGGAGGAGGAVSILGGSVTVKGGDNAVGIGGGTGGNGAQGGTGGTGGAGWDSQVIDVKNVCAEKIYGAYVHNFIIQSPSVPKGGDGDCGNPGVRGAGGDGAALTVAGGRLTVYGGAGAGISGTNGEKNTATSRGVPPQTYGLPMQESYANGAWYALPASPVSRLNANKGGIRYGEYVCASLKADHGDKTLNSLIWLARANGYSGVGGWSSAGSSSPADPSAGTVKIKGSNNNVNFIPVGDTPLSWNKNRPTDTNGTLLYKTVVTVKNLEGTDNLPNSTISIPVDGKERYNYETVTDDNGQGIVWLPVGDYVLKGKMVNSSANGYMTEAKTLTVKANDSNEITINVGVPLRLKTSNENKVYFKEDSVNPLDIIVDGTAITGSLEKIRWFRENINDNEQMYGTGSVLYKTFQNGYDNAAVGDKSDAVALTDNDKKAEIPVNQNGRYWFEIEVLLTDDEVNRSSVTLTKLLTVDNIYREYAIQTRSREMKHDGDVKYTSEYGPLKTALGTDYTISYGFAWDLNGYKSQTLVQKPSKGWDTVQVAGLNTKVKWYNAAFGAQNTPIEKNAAKNGFQSVALKLDRDFLTNNQDADKPDGNLTADPTKYTITYTPEGVPVAEVTIRGIVQHEDGSEKTQLWSITNSFPENVTEADIEGWPQAGYRIDKVLVDGTDKTAELRDGVIHLTDMSGTETNNYTDAVQKVEFVYVNNMTDVTVKAVLNDAKKDTENATKVSATYTVPVEIGTEKTFVPPMVDGYTCVGSSKGDTYKIDSVAANDSITFYYEKAQGNVTYQAVCEEKNGTKTVLWTDHDTVQKGHAPADKTPDKGVDNYTKDDTAGTKYTITGTDTQYPNGGKFNGTDDITVTYTYKHTTRKVQVQWMNILNSKVVQTDTPVGMNVGEYASISSTVPAGYTVVGSSTATIFVDNKDTTQLTATLYCKPSDEATITIQMFSEEESEKQDGTPFNTVTLTASYDAEQTVTAPTLLGWKLKTGEDDQKKITPTKGQANTVKFVYEKDMETITVNLKVKDGAATTDLPADSKPAGWTGKFKVQKGQRFTIAAPSIVNYKLTADDKIEKTLSAEDIIGGNKSVDFTYEKAEADLITITVKGVKDGNELYSYTKDVKKSADAVAIQVFTLAGYKLDNVEMGGTPVTAKDGTYKINPQGTAQTVTATYSSNMADVTINAYYKDTTKTVEGFTPFKVKAEIGKPYSYGTLTLLGYDNDGAAPSIANVKAQGNTLTYYFTKQTGNVVYQLVEDGHADHILATKSETVAKGATIDAAAANAPTATNWKLADGQTEGEIVGAVDGKFDGVHAVTVTYKAVPKTKDVTIVRYDVDTNQIIPLTTDEQNLGKTLTATLATGKMHTLQKANYLPAGYTISGKDAVEVYVEDDAKARTVNMYFRRSTDTDEDVTVNLVYTDEQNHKQTIQTYLVQRKPGTMITVKAPDMAYKGYTAKMNSVDVQPTQNSVEIEYTVTYYDIEIKLLDEHDQPLNTPADYETNRKVRKGEGIVLTAPSIADYTLTSALVVSKTAKELDQVANRTITFRYKNTAASNYVTHTIKLMDADANTLITQYTSVVAKSDTAKTTYLAPLQDGYQVSPKSQEISNATSRDVVFEYTKSAATITIHFVDTNGKPLTGYENGQILTGYEKGQTVMVTAPAVSGKALAGLYNATAQGDKVTPLTGVTTIVTIPKGQPNVDVTFAYKEQGTYKFHLVDQAGTEIKTVTGENGTFSTKTGGNLDLTDSGWKFDHANNNNTAPFNTENAELTIGDDTTVKEYTLYYTRMTRPVTYKYVDVTDGQKKDINFNGATNNPQTTNVGENLITSAPQIPGYTPNALRNVTFVMTGTDAVTVTFEYIKKATGSITVVHKLSDSDKVITSYTVSGSVGEWFTATKLATNNATGITTDGKYKFTESATNQATQSVQYTANAQTLTFVYEPNYVTVNTYISVDGAETEYQTGIEVVKTTGTQKLYAPSKTGYVLKGITVTKNVVMNPDGSATTFPDYWQNNELTLTNLTSDVKVVYSYEKINDNIKDYQATITVKDQYETYRLGGRTETVIKDVNAEIASKAYDGYVLIAYQIGDSADQKQTVEADKANNFKLTHKFDKNTTVTFFYGRADGSAVVPGGDMNFGTGDDVIIKPKDDNKPSVNPDGSVQVPNGAEVVTPNGTVIPPNGSIVKPNGTIVAPGTDGTTNPGVPIDPSNPSDNGKYIFVQYKANGGVGESYTEIFLKDSGKVTLKKVSDLFTYKDHIGNGWNTSDVGLGTPYTSGDQKITKSVVLYAQWEANKVPTGKYTATVVLNSNGASDKDSVTQTIASDTTEQILATLQENPFTVKADLAGWTFRGWNTVSDGSGVYYADKGKVSVAKDDSLTLFAQWAKTGADGSITVPGKDNLPGTDDDVTVKPGNGGKLDRDDKGTITVPATGGSAVKKDNEIDMPNGGTVKPDGEIIIKQPDGPEITIDKDGNPSSSDGSTVFCVTYKPGYTGPKDVKVYFTSSVTVSKTVFTRKGYVFGYWTNADNDTVAAKIELNTDTTLTAHWYAQGEDGSITVPGTADKDVIVKPTDGAKPEVKDDGTVTIPGTGPVETPDGPVIVPEGSVVKPDGSVVNGNDKLYPTTDGATPTGYIKVTYNSGIDSVKPVVQLAKGTEVEILHNSPFGEVKDKTFLYWNDVNGKKFTDTTVTADTILTAQWKNTDSVILSVADGSKVKTVKVDGQKQNILTMCGKWTEVPEDEKCTIPVLVDGKAAAADDLRWYVDAKSYVEEFGFDDSVLTGDDIIAIDAQSGEIRVKHSGIVRVYCESVTDSSIKLSFVLVVPGDMNKDGLVDLDDVDYAVEVATPPDKLSDSAEDYFIKLLGDMDKDGVVDLDDVNELVEIATYTKEI